MGGNPGPLDDAAQPSGSDSRRVANALTRCETSSLSYSTDHLALTRPKNVDQNCHCDPKQKKHQRPIGSGFLAVVSWQFSILLFSTQKTRGDWPSSSGRTIALVPSESAPFAGGAPGTASDAPLAGPEGPHYRHGNTGHSSMGCLGWRKDHSVQRKTRVRQYRPNHRQQREQHDGPTASPVSGRAQPMEGAKFLTSARTLVVTVATGVARSSNNRGTEKAETLKLIKASAEPCGRPTAFHGIASDGRKTGAQGRGDKQLSKDCAECWSRL